MVCFSQNVAAGDVMKICVLIPAYNCGRTIGEITKKIARMGLKVVVVDDGSTDNTESAASQNGAIVARHVKNMGKGASLKEGFELARRMSDIDAIIIMDGDGQHCPDDLKNFISRAEEGSSDVIVGNRMDSVKNMPFIRLLTNKIMSGLLSLMCRQHIPDTQCGFRLVKKAVLDKIKLKSNRYDLDSELLIKASRKRFRISSVPIQTIYRDEESRIHPLKDTFRFIWLLVKSFFTQ